MANYFMFFFFHDSLEKFQHHSKDVVSKFRGNFYFNTVIEEARIVLLRCMSLPEDDKRAKKRKSNTNAASVFSQYVVTRHNCVLSK